MAYFPEGYHDRVKPEYGDTMIWIARDYSRYSNGKTWEQLWTLSKQRGGVPWEDNILLTSHTIFLLEEEETTNPSGTPTASPSSASTNTVDITLFTVQAHETRTMYCTWECALDHVDHYEIEWRYTNGSERADGTPMAFYGNGDSPTATPYKYFTFSVDEAAILISIRVRPVSTTYRINDGKDNAADVHYWDGKWTAWKYRPIVDPPEAPGALTAAISNDNLTITVSSIPEDAKRVQIQVVRDAERSYFYENTVIVDDVHNTASATVYVSPGHIYYYRARSATKDGLYSSYLPDDVSWNSIESRPSPPTDLTLKAKIGSDNTPGVLVSWTNSSTASVNNYKIQYTQFPEYFDYSGTPEQITEVQVDTPPAFIGISTGVTYYFRVKAVSDAGESDWTGIKKIIIGEPPAPPTTWSSTTSAKVSDQVVTVYWTHNSADGSDQTGAILYYQVGQTGTTVRFDQDDPSSPRYYASTHYDIPISNYSSGARIFWKVATKGATNEFDLVNGYSTTRVITVWATPSLALGVKKDDVEISTLNSYPFTVTGTPSAGNQTPISYSLNIISTARYTTFDQVGNGAVVDVGQSVYSRVFNRHGNLSVELNAYDVDLQNGITYTVKLTVAMSSGLTASASKNITVQWRSIVYTPTARVYYNRAKTVASINPFVSVKGRNLLMGTLSGLSPGGLPRETSQTQGAHLASYTLAEKLRVGQTYTASMEIKLPAGVTQLDVYTRQANKSTGVNYTANLHSFTNPELITGRRIRIVYPFVCAYSSQGINYSMPQYFAIRYLPDDGSISANTNIYWMKLEEGETNTDYLPAIEDGGYIGAYLAVYRREFDGSFTKLSQGLTTGTTYVTDPHPSLDYARYRIVATDIATGTVSFTDLPGYPVQEKSIIIQWDEQWTDYNNDEPLTIVEPSWTESSWTGSLLKLPYNIDVSDTFTPDTALVEYVGREHPVSYYGTQVGHTATWSTAIPKTDSETLYALRRLSRWMGDVYVREPSGSGYWANVTVSFSQTHLELTIPVTLNVTRVEGGK